MTSTTTATHVPPFSTHVQSNSSQIPSAQEILSSLHHDGYVVVRQLIPLSSPLFARLISASRNLVSAALA
ncbi:MAG: hypothetical protein LQ340_006014, partial [Diploschistes diacapsis]